jgi:hypothetical protein
MEPMVNPVSRRTIVGAVRSPKPTEHAAQCFDSSTHSKRLASRQRLQSRHDHAHRFAATRHRSFSTLAAALQDSHRFPPSSFRACFANPNSRNAAAIAARIARVLVRPSRARTTVRGSTPADAATFATS